jgi:hypothetical protein
MIRWWDYTAAFGFAWLIWTNASIAVIFILTGNIILGGLCAYAAYAVYNWWDDWYIPFRIKLEDGEWD